MGMPTNTARRWLEDLAAVGLVRRMKTSGKDDRWQLRKRWRKLLLQYNDIKQIDETLVDFADELPEHEVKAVKEDIEESRDPHFVQNVEQIFGG